VFAKLYDRIRLLGIKNKKPYFAFYKMLGFYPRNIRLYEHALLHKSSSIEDAVTGKGLNNERLEFLGDAILDSIVAEILYTEFPNKREGFLTNTRSKIVQRETLNRVAIELGLDKFIVYSIKINSHNKCIYGNALEALIGAIYLDQGYEKCKRFINDVIIKKYINLEDTARKEVNFKSNLIEWGQKNKIEITFELIESFNDEEGNPIFQSQVNLLGKQIGVGIGFSKKESHQNAAKMASDKIRRDKEVQQLIAETKKARSEALKNNTPSVVDESADTA
jgi:ribonuclease-3